MAARAIVWAVVALLMAAVPASAATRVALVIGNGAYQNVPPLSNPVNDAGDLSQSLQRLGFDVKTALNASYNDMRLALIDFAQKADGAEIAVIFFAGHGLELGGENWLIPVDAKLETDVNVGNEAIGLHQLMGSLEHTSKLGLVILDACRNNPFLPRMRSGSGRVRSADRGFTRVEPFGNLAVAYAARDGTTASDGSGRNSPFTQALLKNIEQPDLEVRFLFANVRDEVMAATTSKQQPFLYQSLSSERIYFKRSSQNAVADADAGGGATLVKPADNPPPKRPSENSVANLGPVIPPIASLETHAGPSDCNKTAGDDIVVGVNYEDADGGLVVRAAPHASATPQGLIPAAAVGVRRDECQNGWCKVAYRCLTGWASSQYLSPRSLRLSSVVGVQASDPDGLNVRAGPGTGFSVQASIPYNATSVVRHTCESKSGTEWCLVSYGSTSGWVASRYLTR